MFIDQAKKELEQLDVEIAQLSEEISSLPEGHISFKKNGPYLKWMFSINGTRKVIRKKNIEFASLLAKKKYISARKKDLLSNREFLSQYIYKAESYQSHESEIMQDDNLTKLLKFANTKSNLQNTDKNLLESSKVSYINEWINASYPRNEKYPDQLKLFGLSGIPLRSKSEVIIEQALTLKNIPFRYECLLQLDEMDFYPDFTILVPTTCDIIIWEHFGMMDNPQYSQNALQKLNVYISHGYLPGANMIVTFETSNMPLDVRYINSIINTHFKK